MTKRDRCQQVLRWLVSTQPPPYPVSLRFTEYADATFDFGGSSFVADPKTGEESVVIDLCISEKMGSLYHWLVHEYVHAATWPPPHIAHLQPQHRGIWAAVYGDLYDKFFEEGGCEASREF